MLQLMGRTGAVSVADSTGLLKLSQTGCLLGRRGRPAEFIAMLQLMGRTGAVSVADSTGRFVNVGKRTGDVLESRRTCERAQMGAARHPWWLLHTITYPPCLPALRAHLRLPAGVLPRPEGAGGGGIIPLLPRCELLAMLYLWLLCCCSLLRYHRNAPEGGIAPTPTSQT